MRVRLIVMACCVFPSAAEASSGDAARFARFARSAHASGTVTLTLRFTDDRATCAAHDTCGRSGKVTTRLRFDAGRPLGVGDTAVSLPVRGSVTARTRDTAAGSACASKGSVPVLALRFGGDGRGLLLRPAGAPGTDPFGTSCRAPRLSDFGAAALPAVRLRRVAPRVSTIRLKLRSTRNVTGGGYAGRLSARGEIDLRR